MKKAPDNTLYQREPTTGEDAGEFWQHRFDRALTYRRQHWNGDKAWKRYLNLYKGKHWSALSQDSDTLSSDLANDEITVNITGSSCLNMLPFLIRKRPKFNAKAKRPEFDVSAKIQKATLNYSWGEYDMQKQARKCALDGIIIGHAVMKSGFTLEVNESYKIPSTGRIEYRDYIKKQAPWIRRVSPFMMVFDPEAPEQDFDSGRWCGEMMFLPLQDIIENQRYSKAAIKAIQEGKFEPSRIDSVLKDEISDDGLTWLSNDADEYGDLTRIVCFEIWDKRSGKYFFFAHGVHIPLIEKETWPYDYLEGFPYDWYEFIPVPEEPYALGLPASIEDQQYELNRIRTAMFQHRRRFNRKYTATDDVNESELTKLQEGADGTIIKVLDHDAIKPIQEAAMSSDEYNIEGIIKQDIRELIGSDEMARGGNLPSRTTATEVQARTKLYGLKLEDRVEQFDRFIEKVGRKVNQHMKANWVTTDVVKIVGPTGYYWETWNREDIQAEVDIDIEATSTEMVDEVTERQLAIQILQIMTANMQILMQAGVPVEWTELFKWVLSKFESLEDVQRWFPAAATVNAPIAQAQAGQQPGITPGAPGGFNPQAPPSQNPNPVMPPSPMAQQAQPAGGPGNVLSGLMGALGGVQ